VELCEARCSKLDACLATFVWSGPTTGYVDVCDGLSALGSREGVDTSVTSRSYFKRVLGSFGPRKAVDLVADLAPGAIIPNIDSLVTGDFTGDNKTDIVVGFVYNLPLKLLSRNENDEWAATAITGAESTVEMATVHLSSPTALDIVYITYTGVKTLRHTGPGSFAAWTTIGLYNYGKIIPADLSSRGYNGDFVLLASSVRAIAVVQHQGNGVFTHRVISVSVYDSFISDMALDPRDHTRLFFSGYDEVYVMQNISAGTPVVSSIYALSSTTSDIVRLAVGPFMSSESTDVLIVTAARSSRTANTSLVILPSEDVGLEFSKTLPITSFSSLDVGDATNDDVFDIVISGASTSTTMDVLVYKSIDSRVRALEDDQLTLESSISYRVTDNVVVDLVDMTGDGEPDLLTAPVTSLIEYLINGAAWDDQSF